MVERKALKLTRNDAVGGGPETGVHIETRVSAQIIRLRRSACEFKTDFVGKGAMGQNALGMYKLLTQRAGKTVHRCYRHAEGCFLCSVQPVKKSPSKFLTFRTLTVSIEPLAARISCGLLFNCCVGVAPLSCSSLGGVAWRSLELCTRPPRTDCIDEDSRGLSYYWKHNKE